MLEQETPIVARAETSSNIGFRLTETAGVMPDEIAIAVPSQRDRAGRRRYHTLTFRELDQDSNQLASGLQKMGIQPGMRIVLMVRAGIDFISLSFALFKTGAVVVLIDPGMPRQHLVQCLEDVTPDGFVAISVAQAARIWHRRRFPRACHNVTVGRRWFWGGPTIEVLRTSREAEFQPPAIDADSSAAIIFTTGSTGAPKGVLYRHGNFASQVDQLRDHYNIRPGEIDLPGFPLFALFNSAMGVTTVMPDMNPTRPADVDPENIIEAVNDWNVTQAFGSPALWNVVGRHCEQNKITLPSLRRVLSAGAPVPPHVLRRMKNAIAVDGDMHTPYGATESLPVASISASEVLGETAQQSQIGAGTCVGRRFPGIQWKVIRISDDAIEEINSIEELPVGQIGELIVTGPVVTRAYVTRTESNALAKIPDGQAIWHRMGDVGYLDEKERFWFCGRMAHRVKTIPAAMFTVPCEAIFNCHKSIYRSALVGLGSSGVEEPVLIAEPWPEHHPKGDVERQRLIGELYELGQANPLTKAIKREHILLHESLPVDIRHNAKIFREKLRPWAAEQLGADLS